ncbi:MAG: DUF488 family protein [Pseudomonadota bacterium]|jgi:uncharacterized protein YeaO (DUF488 family)
MSIHVKRIYDEAADEDGFRVLVDRLWPRGVTKQGAKIDAWFKDLAPSNELRKWYGHDTEKWDEFRNRYFSELDRKPEQVAELAAKARAGRTTLLYAAADTRFNNAVALREYLDRVLSPPRARP